MPRIPRLSFWCPSCQTDFYVRVVYELDGGWALWEKQGDRCPGCDRRGQAPGEEDNL